MLKLLAETVAETTPGGFDLTMIMTYILPFGAIILVFYFMLIRPENKRKKSTQKMLSELKVGSDVVTRGGVIGKITAIKDDKITIKSGNDGMTFQVMRWAISSTGGANSEPVQ